MKKTAVIMFLVVCIVIAVPVFSAEGGKKGASPKAYEHASENAVFNRVGDWFATIGKSEEEKTKMLEQRKAERAVKLIEKEARKTKKKAEKETKKIQKKAAKDTSKVKQKIKGLGKK